MPIVRPAAEQRALNDLDSIIKNARETRQHLLEAFSVDDQPAGANNYTHRRTWKAVSDLRTISEAMSVARNIAASAVLPQKDEKPGGICIACTFTVAKGPEVPRGFRLIRTPYDWDEEGL